MIIARQSTARIVTIGPVIDDEGVAVTDGVVADFKIAKNGGAPAALNGSATAVHRHTGFYSLALTTSDLDTVGQAEITIDDTVNSMPQKEITIIEEAVYDALFAASAPGYVANAPVNVAQFGGTNGTFASGIPAVNATQISGDSTAADNLETAFDDTAGPVPWLGIVDQGTAQSASATGVVLRSAAAFDDDVLIGCTIGVHGSDQGYWQFQQITDNALTGDAVVVDGWQVTPTGTITYKIFGGPPAPATPPEVNAIQISGDGTAADTLELFAEALDQATGQLDSGSLAAGTLTATAIASDAFTAAKFAADVGTEIGTAVWASATRVLTAATNISGPIADQVWEEALADHEGTVGSTAEALADAGGSGASAADIADAVLDEALSGHTTAGTLGKAIADTLEDTGTTIPALFPANFSTVTIASNAVAANVTQFGGTNGTFASGLPRVNLNPDQSVTGIFSIDSLGQLLENLNDAVASSGVTVATNNDKTGYALSSSGIDAILIESGISAGAGLTNDTGTQLTAINARQAMALFAAALEGVLAGAATTTITIKPVGNPSGNTRVTATVDSDGNRSALVLKVPD